MMGWEVFCSLCMYSNVVVKGCQLRLTTACSDSLQSATSLIYDKKMKQVRPANMGGSYKYVQHRRPSFQGQHLRSQ